MTCNFYKSRNMFPNSFMSTEDEIRVSGQKEDLNTVFCCVWCALVFLCALYMGLSFPLLYLWYITTIPMYNRHAQFSLKNLGKEVHIIHGKIWGVCRHPCVKHRPQFIVKLIRSIQISCLELAFNFLHTLNL